MIPVRDSIPSERLPFVNWLIIAANIAVYVHMRTLSESAAEVFVYRWGVVPALLNPAAVGGWSEVVHSLPSLITCAFLHAGPGHLVGNMWALYIFGDNIEGRLGHFHYAMFYVLCGAVASAAHTYMNLESVIPLVGASGAISGVMGAYLVAFPYARVLMVFWFIFFLRMIWVPASGLLVLWFVLDLARGLMTRGTGEGIAHWAHVAGFVAGFVLLRISKWRNPDEWIVSTSRMPTRPTGIREPRRYEGLDR